MQLMRNNITLIPDGKLYPLFPVLVIKTEQLNHRVDFSIARTGYLNSPLVLAAFEK